MSPIKHLGSDLDFRPRFSLVLLPKRRDHCVQVNVKSRGSLHGPQKPLLDLNVRHNEVVGDLYDPPVVPCQEDRVLTGPKVLYPSPDPPPPGYRNRRGRRSSFTCPLLSTWAVHPTSITLETRTYHQANHLTGKESLLLAHRNGLSFLVPPSRAFSLGLQWRLRYRGRRRTARRSPLEGLVREKSKTFLPQSWTRISRTCHLP